MHFRCTFAPACDVAASRLRIASCLSPLPVLPFCGRRPPSGIEYPEMICYTCIDTIRISDADQSVFAGVPSMNDSRDFKKEYDVFLQKVPYQTAVVDDIKVRYQYGGMDGAPVILFFNGLEMQEMWMPYAERLGKKYRFLIYEYPFHTVHADEQIDFAAKLLKALSIDRVILIGASDGGVYAQIFAKRHPGSVSAMILTTTLTVDSDYVRDIRKERFSTPMFLLLLKLVPAKTERTICLSRNGILRICGEKYRFSFRKKTCSKRGSGPPCGAVRKAGCGNSPCSGRTRRLYRSDRALYGSDGSVFGETWIPAAICVKRKAAL